MKCPYCNSELPDNSNFCDKCGQPIPKASNYAENTDKIQKYWNDVDTLTDANENQRLKAIYKKKSEEKEKTTAATRNIIVAVAVIALIVISAVSLNANSQKRLALVKATAIGNTYSDANGPGTMFEGDERDRIIVTIKDENTLSYTSGNYTLQISSKEGGGHTISWRENSIYETSDYEYSFSTSLFGKVTLNFNGNSYPVTIDDDGTIFSITFYKN